MIVINKLKAKRRITQLLGADHSGCTNNTQSYHSHGAIIWVIAVYTFR